MQVINFIKFLFFSQPAFLTQYTFTKKDKTVVLQEMVHVSHGDTYESINHDIKKFIEHKPDAKIYLEGVYGEKKDSIKFNNKLASLFGLELVQPEVMFLKDIYQSVASITGWQMQGTHNYLKDIEESKLVKADITYSQMYEYIKNIEDDHKKEKIKFSINPKLINFLKTIKLPGYAAKKIITNVVINTKADNQLSKSTGKFKELFTVILNKRNEHLLHMIEKNSDKNIFVTYGAAHPKGIKNELQQLGYTCTTERKINFKF